MTPPESVGAAIDSAVALLREAGFPDPRREAEAILAHLLRTDRGGVVARRPDPLSNSQAAQLAGLVQRRAAREPFQYLTGECEFLGLTFAVNRFVLVPRPETAELVESVLGWDLPHGGTAYDLGTGSGCIAITLAVRRPDLHVIALERSARALEVARANAALHEVAARVRFVECDFASPPAEWHATGALVVSNPPYVSEEEWRDLAPEVRDFEPREALVPGPTGHEAYAAVARSAASLLSAGGKAAVELGWKSLAEATRAFAAAGFAQIEALDDARGIPRILRARRGVV